MKVGVFRWSALQMSILTGLQWKTVTHHSAWGQEPTCRCRRRGRPGFSIPGLGRSPGGGHGNPTPCLDLENPMDGGAWQATVREVAKSRIRWSNLTQSALWGRWPHYKDRAGCRRHLRGRKSVSVERVIPSHFTSPVLLLTSCFKYSISVWLHSVILSPDSRWSTLGKFCG